MEIDITSHINKLSPNFSIIEALNIVTDDIIKTNNEYTLYYTRGDKTSNYQANFRFYIKNKKLNDRNGEPAMLSFNKTFVAKRYFYNDLATYSLTERSSNQKIIIETWFFHDNVINLATECIGACEFTFGNNGIPFRFHAYMNGASVEDIMIAINYPYSLMTNKRKIEAKMIFG